MLILGLDLETTTYLVDELRVTELGAVLYDTELKVPIEVQADIVFEPDVKLPMDEFIVGLTGISDKMVLDYGKRPEVVLDKFFELYSKAEYVVAHNGNEFDRPAMQRFISRYFEKVEGGYKPILGGGATHAVEVKPWLDTMIDVPYGQYVTTRKLEDLTGRHGFLNPFPHRAFTDVMAMLRILSEYDINEVIAISESPTLCFQANVDYHSRDLAKSARFRWNSEKRKWLFKEKKIRLDETKYLSGRLWDFPYVEVPYVN